MSKVIERIIERLKSRTDDEDSPIRIEGAYDGGEFGYSPGHLEIDWPKLQAEMEACENE